jgi:hypothetical protein
MEFDPWPLVNQQKDKSGHPTECVAQQPGNIFSETFAAGRDGCRNWRSGCALACAALGAEIGCADVLTTRFAESHGEYLRK